MNDPRLAELNTATLDVATIAQLIDDLETCTRVLDVLTKGAARARANPEPVTLREAHQMLMAGQCRGVQIRYHYDGSEWRDTLMQTQEGIRLVRMQMDFP